MTVWFENPKQLFATNEILKFWPNSSQTPDERVNASTRFILYLSTSLYLLKRDPRILVLGLMVISMLYFLYKDGRIAHVAPVMSVHGEKCKRPEVHNAMANVLMTDYVDRPDRPSACDYNSVKHEVSALMDDTFPYDAGRSRSPLPHHQRKAAARQFFINPVTQIPNNQTEFAEFCYGKKNRKMCRDSPEMCDPNFWGVQTEAFAGLDPSGDMRSGMLPRATIS